MWDNSRVKKSGKRLAQMENNWPVSLAVPPGRLKPWETKGTEQAGRGLKKDCHLTAEKKKKKSAHSKEALLLLTFESPRLRKWGTHQPNSSKI